MFKFNKVVMGITLLSSQIISANSGMVSLSDNELSDIQGQALFNLSYIAPSDSENLMTGKTNNGVSVGNVGFYKLGMEAEIELNANIKTLQLGCGGVNGPGACDIEIFNLALSGPPDHYDSVTGAPVYLASNPRPSTSAVLTNPFIEFAIKDPDKASTREIMGFRVSAEEILGLLTLGVDNERNYPDANDGLQTLSGFMRIAPSSGSVTTKETLFGDTADQRLGAYSTSGPYSNREQKPNLIVDMSILGTHKRIFTSQPGNAANHGITIPSMSGVGFETPAFQVNGVRQSDAYVEDIRVHIGSIPMGKVACTSDSSGYCSAGAKNQLYVTFDSILGLVSNSRFKMKDGSDVKNLWLNATFIESLSMIHNIPLSGNGAYLALQNQKILWPGNYISDADAAKTELDPTATGGMTTSDVANQGWWMSFKNEVDLGKLDGAEPVNISSVLPQVASLVSKALQDDPVKLDMAGGLGVLFSGQTEQLLNIPLEDYTNFETGNPARVTLQNMKIQSQDVVSNCWGNLKFC